ncbi:MAG: ABC transporter substrate-binding protein [Gordonia sp. (in: high G+C Gram-positive bacteria)]|uniref:ABC transporter substrate-binding protein n=1 Tax=Gordonia sp. (in: high G+C Gram-positive bacteria) TaxID=84139 RepID=UPI0039E28BEF
MNRRRRAALRTAAVGLAAVLAATLTSCGGEDRDQIDYLTNARVGDYNVNTVDGYASGAIMALARVLPGFTYLGPDGQVVADRDIGTVVPEAGSSLTLTYTFDEKAVWSDGAPMVCDDLLLAATAMGGKAAGFTPATTAGYRDIARVDCRPGEKSAVVTFTRGRDYAEWRALFGVGTLLPAHVVARKAGVDDIVAALTDRRRETLGRIAEAWNTGFTLQPGKPVDEKLLLSAGPYRVGEYAADGALRLVVNDKWWGERAAISRITVWTRGRGGEKALNDGSIEVVESGDLTAGDRLKGRTVKKLDGTENRAGADDPRPLSVTQLVLAGSGVAADRPVRQAFASCVPRDALARRFGANGVVWSMRTVAPANALGGALNGQFARRYPRADVSRARALLGSKREGARRPARNLRLGYVAPDPVAEALVKQIVDSCQAAGLTVTDASSAELTPAALGTDVDVLLTRGATGSAAAGSASTFPDAYQLFGDDPLNLSGFRDPKASGAINDLSLTSSDSARLPLVRDAETAAWETLPSIPLFGTVRVREHSDGVEQVVPGMARTGTGWNMDRWVRR